MGSTISGALNPFIMRQGHSDAFFGCVLRYVISLPLALSSQNTERLTHEDLPLLTALSDSGKSDGVTLASLPKLDPDKTKGSKFR